MRSKALLWPKVANFSQKQPKVAKSSQIYPKVAKSSKKKQPNEAKSSQKQPKVSKSSPKLPKVAKSCHLRQVWLCLLATKRESFSDTLDVSQDLVRISL